MLILLPALACGAMVIVFVRMMSGHGRGKADNYSKEEIAELREEVARLRAARMLEDRGERVDG